MASRLASCISFLRPTGLATVRRSNHALSAAIIDGAAICPVRSIAMTTSDFRSPHAQYDPDNAEAGANRPSIPTPSLPHCTASHRIGIGIGIGTDAAADGQPWSERHQLTGRCLRLAGTDCPLATLRRGGGADADCGADSAERRTGGIPEGSLNRRVEDSLYGVDCAGC